MTNEEHGFAKSQLDVGLEGHLKYPALHSKYMIN
jgi:hypothetical protein